MKTLARALALTTLPLAAIASVAHAQYTYTYYPTSTTINAEVSTDFSIVGYAGGSYDDDFNPNFTSPSSPTVQIATGANIDNEIDVFNNSTVSITGGTGSDLFGYDSSAIKIRGGSFDFILGFDNSVIDMSSGLVNDLEGQGKQINISGGTANTLVANTQSDYYGNSLGSCVVNVTGGNIGVADAYNDGIFNIRGGIYQQNLYAEYGGTINIYGSGLRATLTNPSFNNRFSQYTLFGTLADGSSVNNTLMYIENPAVTYGHSSFNLYSSAAAPEPGSLAFAVCGVLSAGALRLRRKNR